MGCCGGGDKGFEEFPFEKMEEFNRLKNEVSDIITNQSHKYRKNSQKLIDLFNKTSLKITDYEREVRQLKNKNQSNGSSSDRVIHGMFEDIKQLKEYNRILNNLIKSVEENKSIEYEERNIYSNKCNDDIIEKDNEEIMEAVNISNEEKINNNENENMNNELKQYINQNELDSVNYDFKKDFKTESDINLKDKDDDFYNDFEQELNIMNNINHTVIKDQIYYKKSLRRNKKSPKFNRKSTSKKNNGHGEFGKFQNNNIFNLNEFRLTDDNIIKLIFIFENGEVTKVEADKNVKLLTIVEKIVTKKEKYRNIENIEFLNGDMNITEKIKNGDPVSSFGFDDNNYICVKLIGENY